MIPKMGQRLPALYRLPGVHTCEVCGDASDEVTSLVDHDTEEPLDPATTDTDKEGDYLVCDQCGTPYEIVADGIRRIAELPPSEAE